MTSWTRRDFLRSALTVVSAGTLMPSIFTRAVAEASMATSPSSAAASPARTLIVVQLAGGNDGLNSVVPFANPRYQELRPRLRIPEDQVIRLDGHLGLHPSLKPLKPLWDAGQLAIVENVGHEHPSFSHFQAMDIWQTADPSHAHHQGWLSTLVDASVDPNGHPFRGLSLGPILSRAFVGGILPPPAIGSLADYQLKPDPRSPRGKAARDDALYGLYGSYASTAPHGALLEATSRTADRSSRALLDAVAKHQPAATYPKGGLADGLRLLAALISQDLGPRVGYVVLGGFDTHALQANHHSQLLQQLAGSLVAFQTDVAAHGKADRVLTMTWSEFGRRAGENASGGTDHGTAAPLFVLGSAVRGGVHGDPPDLDHLDGGNLRFAIDFRSIYATLLDGWLQADSKAILGQDFARIGFLR